ncbi:MAG TPA: hypothetical protein VKH42_21130 [Vicinamibacterales bacterium]|nr:hypothetical protein [Vicinamibacterales bacterium]
MKRRLLFLAAALALTTAVDAQTRAVRISGPKQVSVTAADLAAMPRTKAIATAQGKTDTYEGVLVRELLTKAGVPAGEALRSKDLALAVIVTGGDGYRAAFGVAEFDPAFTDRVAILADKKNGAPLAGTEAPFQLVLTGEKRPSRWVRQVVSIEVVAVGR